MQVMSHRPFDQRPEVELVELAKAGDRSAFSELIHRNYTRSHRLAYSVVSNTAAANDAVGEAFCKAFEHLDQFEAYGQFSSWLGRIVMNEGHKILRNMRRANAIEFEERTHSTECRQKSSYGLTPEEQLRHSELLAVMTREIRRIPGHLREPFLMRVADRPMDEIAAQMGLSLGAVKSRVRRARTQLRMRLGHHLPNSYTHA
jgi:RNA polymerase sigma-70 factor, ECF subfamily